MTVNVLPAVSRQYRQPTRLPSTVVRVVVVDSRPVYRAGVRAALHADPGISVVAEIGSPAELYDVVARYRPDVAIVELHTGGLSLCRSLVERFPRCRTVVLGPPDDDVAVVGSVRAGARGYLRTTAGSAAYPAAVRAVARGRTAFDAAAAAAVRRALAVQEVRDDRLTPRELEVLRLAGEGMSTPEIAARLELSCTTVKSYLGNVMRKLGVSRRAGAVYVGRERGLI
ncbi:LuxR C-terminal-related transcriptional regulator [Pseudonocardia sp. GCM10023141]|uniref:LuxR C-terminal-related transcriptional regulator n=1 Tax=Pseudonocardia sp. GCM10023141 TaxID=3252653 RepID=UPI00360F5DE4